MGNKRLIWFCLIVLMGSISAYSEVRLKPIFQGNIFGNISDAEEAKPSFRGNAEIRFVPVVEVGDKTAFLPILRASYVGNQTPIKIADEGTLLQQTQEYHGELVALRDLSEKTTLSLRGGRTEILLRETVDEDWGHGLYDHNLTFGGMGLEHRVSPEFLPTRLRLDAEYSWIRYPNYLSLGSQSGIDNIGAKELDTNSWQVFFKGETSLGIRHFITYGVGLSQDDYVDQRVIAAVGTISQKKRQDSLLDVLARWDTVFPGAKIQTGGGFGFDGRKRLSSQNSYDVTTLRFLGDYYNYDEVGLSPSAYITWIKPRLTASVGANWGYRMYSTRPAQDTLGNYRDIPMKTKTRVLQTQIACPIARRVKIEGSANWYSSKSNNEYETYYNYNYKSVTYLAGLSVEF